MTEAHHLEPAGQHLSAAVFEAALDAIVVADTDGRIAEFNPAAEQMFGVARCDQAGMPKSRRRSSGP
jgi:PAS domain S-box-containing protein